MTQPTRTSSFARNVRNFTTLFSGAVACAAAAEAGRRPNRNALTAAGIDADTYYNIKR